MNDNHVSIDPDKVSDMTDKLAGVIVAADLPKGEFLGTVLSALAVLVAMPIAEMPDDLRAITRQAWDKKLTEFIDGIVAEKGDGEPCPA